MILHLSGIMPLSPSRHQLVMFLPFCMLVALIVQQVSGKWLSGYFTFGLAIIWFTMAITWQLFSIFGYERGMPVNLVRETLSRENVQRLVLAPCDLEPYLYPDIRKLYQPLYRCGPKIFHTIPDNIDRVAIWSTKLLSEKMAHDILSDYSTVKWNLRPLKLNEDNLKRQSGYLYFAGRDRSEVQRNNSQ